MPPLILASTSRYRRELLERLRLPFSVQAPGVDETPRIGERPVDAAARLARAKAEAVARREPGALVIGSDQTATIDGVEFVGKPGDHEGARRQLRAASGRTVLFHTALALVRQDENFVDEQRIDTRVRFRTLLDDEIEAYLQAEPAYDCAGSAKSEGLGIALLESIDGPDPTALVGLPLIALVGALQRAGVPVLSVPAA
jgi:septum formation protein